MKFFKHGVACFGLSLTLISQADEKMTPPTLENDPEMLWAEWTMVPDTTEAEIDLIPLTKMITACFGLVEMGEIAS